MSVTKRSVALDEEVATAVEQAAREDGLSFSAWLSTAAKRQLKLRDGLRAVGEWEEAEGALTPEERAAGKDLLERLLDAGP